MAYNIVTSKLGCPAITASDSTAALPLGTRVQAWDATYGEGEFIYLLGVASTVVGSLVTFSPTTWQTALCPVTANLSQPVAVAMAANGAASYGWYQVTGLAVVKKTAVKVDPAGTRRVYISGTAGRVMQTSVAGRNILGAASANVATVTSTVSTVVMSINNPHAQGPIT